MGFPTIPPKFRLRFGNVRGGKPLQMGQKCDFEPRMRGQNSCDPHNRDFRSGSGVQRPWEFDGESDEILVFNDPVSHMWDSVIFPAL
jgi:hypothetical protein